MILLENAACSVGKYKISCYYTSNGEVDFSIILNPNDFKREWGTLCELSDIMDTICYNKIASISSEYMVGRFTGEVNIGNAIYLSESEFLDICKGLVWVTKQK